MTTETPEFVIPPNLADKELTSQDIAGMVRSSMIEPQDASKLVGGAGANLIFFLAQVADEIPAWGVNPYYRDVKLRQFFGTESFTTSAIATVIARNMGLNWQLTADQSVSVEAQRPGPMNDPLDRLTDAMQTVLHGADQGNGWLDFTAKLSLDLYTQDRGTNFEIVREADRPDAPVIGLNHLDGLRCWATGDPMYPILYQDRNGHWNKVPWYRGVHLTELPAAHELAYGLQYCALTRILKAAQVFRNIATYQEEKTGGRQQRAVHIVSGVTADELKDAMRTKQALADAQGQMRYMEPAILATLEPNADPKLVTLELASLPESWKMDEMFKWFTVVVSMGLLSDYGDFAPLPGGGLGSATQSEVMYERSKAKGGAIFKALVEHAFNFKGVMPRPVHFEFHDVDRKGEKDEAETRQARAEARSVMLKNQEIDAEAARELALRDGDIPQDIYDEMVPRLEAAAVEEQRQQAEQLAQLQAMQGEPNAAPAFGRPTQLQIAGKAIRTSIPARAGPDEDRLALEEEYASRIEPALKKARDAVARKIRSLA